MYQWYELTRQLEYKAKWNGRKYVKIDRFYASSQAVFRLWIPKYRNKKPVRKGMGMSMSVATTHDRDINAAKNILEEGLRRIA